DWQAFKPNPGRRSTDENEGIVVEKSLRPQGSFPDAPVTRLDGPDALLNFTADGTLLALKDGKVIKYDIEHGGRPAPVLTAHIFDYCELSPNGRFLAGFNSRPKDRHSVLLDEFVSGITNYWEMIGHDGDIHCLAISPDSHYIVTGSADRTARVWDSVTRQSIATLRGHFDEVTAVAWSPNGKLIATGSQDRTIMLWSADPTNRNESLPEPITGAFGPWLVSQDGALLAWVAPVHGGTETARPVICDLAQRQSSKSSQADPSLVASNASTGIEGDIRNVTPVFLSSSRQELLAIQEAIDGQFELRAWDLALRTNALLRALSLPGAQTASLPAPLWAMSPNRLWLARSAEHGNVDVWRVDAPDQVASVLSGNGDPLAQLAFSPDGNTLAVGHTHQ